MNKAISLSRTKGPFILGKYKRTLLIPKTDNGICDKCGKERHMYELILDHIIPVKVGGTDCIFDKSNLWLLCSQCNSEKLSKDFRIIKEMVTQEFFSKGSSWHSLYVPIEKCVEYYKVRFNQLSK